MDKLTLRWRIHEGQLPLRRRHLNALAPLDLPAPLMGWIHERLEWAAINMLNQDSEGILVLNIDPEAEVIASLEDLRDPPALSPGNLVTDAENGTVTGVQVNGELLQGVVWCERDGVLFASAEELTSATATLAKDLAETLKQTVKVQPQLLKDVTASTLFFISDEFGFVPIQNPSTTATQATTKLQDCFAKLW